MAIGIFFKDWSRPLGSCRSDRCGAQRLLRARYSLPCDDQPPQFAPISTFRRWRAAMTWPIWSKFMFATKTWKRTVIGSVATLLIGCSGVLGGEARQCVQDYEMTADKLADYQAALDRLREDMESYRTLHARLSTRPLRAPVKGKPDPLAEARSSIERAAAYIQYDLRELAPIEDYPLAIFGFDRDLRAGSFASTTGHGRAHLKGRSAFIQSVIVLSPEIMETGAEFVAALNESYSLTSADVRALESRRPTFDEILEVMEAAIAAYPAFDAALAKALAHPDFEQRYHQKLKVICAE